MKNYVEINKFKQLFFDMIEKINNKVELIAFILFGSRARGNPLPYSDYDVLVVANFKEKYLDRGKWIVQIAPNVAIDIFTYTPQEFDKKFNSYNLTAIDAIGEGLVLYGEDFYNRYKEKYAIFESKGMKKDMKFQVLMPPHI